MCFCFTFQTDDAIICSALFVLPPLLLYFIVTSYITIDWNKTTTVLKIAYENIGMYSENKHFFMIFIHFNNSITWFSTISCVFNELVLFLYIKKMSEISNYELALHRFMFLEGIKYWISHKMPKDCAVQEVKLNCVRILWTLITVR